MNVRQLEFLAAGVTGILLASLVIGKPRRPEDVFLVLLLVVAVRLVRRPVSVPQVNASRVVGIGVAVYAALFSFVTVTRHWTFNTHALDLGYYVQLTWNLARGHGPRVSLPEMHAWGDHLSPIMYLLAPVFWVAPGAAVLLVMQSVALALGAIPVYAIARRRFDDARAAAALSLLYLLNPSLHGINLRDFHAAALAIPLLLAAMWYAAAERWTHFVVAILLTLACREDAAIAVIGLGIWLVLAQRQVIVGLVTAAAAAGLLTAEVRWIIPRYRGEPYSHLWRYEHLGRSVGEIASTVLLDPVRTAARLMTGRRLLYLLALLAPLCFLPLLAPASLAGALPGLAQNLLSRDSALFHHRTQYQAFVLPFLIVAAIGGYARLAARWPGRLPIIALVVAMFVSLGLGSRTLNHLAVHRFWPDVDQRAAHRLLAQVPPGAAVSAQDPYVPHLSLRELVFVFPVGIEKSDHLVLNLATYPWRNLPGVTLTREDKTVTITADTKNYRYDVSAESASHILLKRRPEGP